MTWILTVECSKRRKSKKMPLVKLNSTSNPDRSTALQKHVDSRQTNVKAFDNVR